MANSKNAATKMTKTAAKSTKSKAKATAKAAAASMTGEKDELSVDRRKPSDRREKAERRTKTEVVANDRRNEERRKAPRRRQIDPTTCERDYSDAEIEFMQAMDDYKRANGRMFPTCSEILEVIQKLGYVKPCSEDATEGTAAIEDADSAEIDEDREEQDESDMDWDQPPADEEI